MDIKEIIESLSPIERKIIPFLNEDNIEDIVEKSGLDRVTVLRALEFLKSKDIISLEIEKEKIVDLGVNGVHYKKNGLPERQLLYLVGEKNPSLSDAQKNSKLSEDEFRAALGALKKKALIELKNGRIIFSGKKEEISKKSLEEQFLEKLPLEISKLTDEDKFSFNSLKDRRGIIEFSDKQIVKFSITELGEKILKEDLSHLDNMLEELTPDLIKKGINGKKFRRYDVTSAVPRITGGKRHFVNQSIDHARNIWAEMGFKEMSGDYLQSSFWNFDSLFTAQDHPVREMQDTFFLDHSLDIPNKELVNKVKKAHELGVGGSKGWRYEWKSEKAEESVLRTHTTCLSSQVLSKLDVKTLPEKFFAIGKCFRNETVDWSHGFEFNQTEGIVIDKNANFRHLLGYLKQFFKKMGHDKIRFSPAYFPYTEPSVEIHVYHEEKKQWLELGGAGIFRPEVVIPLLGEFIPVLAWGPGFDRILMDYYEIKDLRELYKNDIKFLRNVKVWK